MGSRESSYYYLKSAAKAPADSKNFDAIAATAARLLGKAPIAGITLRRHHLLLTRRSRTGVKMGTRHVLTGPERTTIPRKAPLYNPLAAASDTKVADDHEGLTHLGWRAYDWWIRLGNETGNGFYANPIAGRLTSVILETAFRLSDMRDAIAAIVFSNLWTTFGWPSADGILTLRAQVTALHADTRLSKSRH
jgi:hypothetical protein